jgi:hypothetical protein
MASQSPQRTMVLVPFAGQGHVAPMLKLAQVLADHGGDVSITVVVADFIHRRMGPQYRGDGAAGVFLAPIPSGIQDDVGDEPQDWQPSCTPRSTTCHRCWRAC